MAIVISPRTAAHINAKHDVSKEEVRQCFANRTGNLLTDDREQHRSDPQTLWFIAFTNAARLLKICYVPDHGNQYLRTAYPPNDTELSIYRLKGQPSDF